MAKKRNYPFILFRIIFSGGKGLAIMAILLKIIGGILPALYIM